MTVAEMIKKTRTEANMTQEEYGAKFGVSRQTVSSWENERSLPDLLVLCQDLVQVKMRIPNLIFHGTM